jgi:hypothetical protein
MAARSRRPALRQLDGLPSRVKSRRRMAAAWAVSRGGYFQVHAVEFYVKYN